MRVPFATIFQVHADGSVEPSRRIRIGGVTLGPGARFSRGTSIAGVDLTQFTDRDLEVKEDSDVLVITGIYDR